MSGNVCPDVGCPLTGVVGRPSERRGADRERSAAGRRRGDMRYYGDQRMTRFAKSTSVLAMTTMNVSLPDELKIFVDERVSHDGYGSTSEYVRDLIRRDRERGHLRDLVLKGANSGPGVVADAAYFDALRQRLSTEA